MSKIKDTLNFVAMPWKIILIAGIVVSLFVGMFTIDNRFAKSSQLEALASNLEKDTKNKLLLVEAESVKTFQGIQMQQQMTYKAIMMNILIIQKESLDREDVRLRRQIRLYPNDQELKNQLETNRLQRIQIQKNINDQLKTQ